MKNFQNKTAFITGGSSGIGLAIAQLLVKQDCNVVIFARTLSTLENSVLQLEKIRTNPQQKIKAYSVDISVHTAVKEVYAKAVTENDIPDYLINCVGIAQPDYFENITFEIFDKTLKTNLYATWNSCYAMLPFLKQKPKSVIVNTSSIAGFIGVFGYTDYCMTKFGIIGFSEALRAELKKYNIDVKVLCPPDTNTPGLEAENKNKPQETIAIAGNAKLLEPEVVALEVIKKIDTKKFMIIPGLDGKMTLLLKRLFPSIVTFLMEQSINKVQSKK